MAGSSWPTLTPGTKAKASEVEAKFDWLEGSLVPMTGGQLTTGAYDLGGSSSRWRDVYLSSSVNFGASGGQIVSNGNTTTVFSATGVESNPKKSYVHVVLNTDQTISANTVSSGGDRINFSAATIDIQGEWTTTGYFKPKVTGLYAITFAPTVNLNTSTNTSNIAFGYSLDGSTTTGFLSRERSQASGGGTPAVSSLVHLLGRTVYLTISSSETWYPLLGNLPFTTTAKCDLVIRGGGSFFTTLDIVRVL